MSDTEDRIERLEKAVGLKPAVKQTHVFFVLDSSGSMSSCSEAARNNFNEQAKTVQDMANKMGETRCSLILFGQSVNPGDTAPLFGGDLVKAVFLNQKVDRITMLNDSNYIPSGMTPMYDAIGYAIEEAEKVDDGGADTAFLLVIITDGHENYSTKYNSSSISEKIADLRASGRWTVQMMGAEDFDINAARKAGFDEKTFTRYKRSGVGLRAMSSAMSGSIGSYAASRSRGRVAMESLNVEDTEDVAAENLDAPEPSDE